MSNDPLSFPKTILKSLDSSIRFDGMTPNAIASEFREVVQFLATEFNERQSRVDVFDDDEPPEIPRLDASDPVKRVVKWQGLSIGITHESGNHRFSGFPSRPMLKGVSYGHIRRSRKSAPDKKAFDVYYGNQESDSLFKVRQLTLEGLVDEPKYMIGFPSIAAARDVYIAHAGRDRFGGIEQISLDELAKYRLPSYHQDACDCEKCSLERDRQKQKRRKRKKLKLEPEDLGLTDEERADDISTVIAEKNDRLDDDNTDLSDLLTDRSIDATAPAIDKWLNQLSESVSKAKSLEDIRDRLPDLYKQIDDREFANKLMQQRTIADLGGRLEILEELESDDRAEPESTTE